MHSGHDIAKIILSYLDESGDSISNKKLQKLLYYTEAWSLVHLESMIAEDFEAWVHGPVIPSVYREYKDFGYHPIKIDYECGESPVERYHKLIETSGVTPDQWELIQTVLTKYAGLAAFQLENLTHSEQPWIDARAGKGPNENSSDIISKSVIKSYYSSLISDNGEGQEKET